jgi:F-type H+-transporting ATPase subunit epsilon
LPDRVTILAQLAERADEIDVARAEAALKRAQERLAKTNPSDLDYERARSALSKSLSRLQVARINVVPRTSTMKRVRPDQ